MKFSFFVLSYSNDLECRYRAYNPPTYFAKRHTYGFITGDIWYKKSGKIPDNEFQQEQRNA